MNTHKLIVLTLAIIVFTAGCKTRSDKADAGMADSLMIQCTALIDSVNATWNVMIADDDEKHMLMKRLLLEVSYTNNYDKEKFAELNDQVDALNAMRYDQKSMKSSALIDAYDSATWAVTDNVILFARNHPRFEDTPLMEELINDINEKNSFVLIHRIHYDTSVKALNAFVETNGASAKNMVPAMVDGPMPLFELPS